ncbi:MAG: hypothetical protein ACWA5A_14450 [Marinibacterium sp.]
MGVLKTYLTVCLFLTAGAAAALPRSPSQRAQLFATCAGRYSALAEHQRMFDGAASETADAQRAAFEALLDAVLPDARDWGMPGEMALQWRLAAKLAQAELLQRSTFQSDSSIAETSRHAADRLFGECRGWVLGQS